MALVVKNMLGNAGDIRHTDSIPRLGRYPGGGHGNPLQDSRQVTPMDRGAWWATDHGVTNTWTRLSNRACRHSDQNDPERLYEED